MAIEVLAGTLRDHTTLRVGGGAQLIVRVTTDQELIDLADFGWRQQRGLYRSGVPRNRNRDSRDGHRVGCGFGHGRSR